MEGLMGVIMPIMIIKAAYLQNDGRFEGHLSQQPPMKKPASFKMYEGQLPTLRKSGILTVEILK
ncbi:hypothetical protein ACE6H2_028600 [Prunus campanulata]